MMYVKAVRIEVKNTLTGETALMEVTGDTKLQEILDSAVELWSLPREAYLMRSGRKLLLASKTVEENGLNGGECIELLPDPEGG